MAKVTKPEEQTTEPSTQHKVLSPLKHNGKRYKVGDVLVLTASELKVLVEVGTVSLDEVVTQSADDEHKPEGDE
jgi:hypothetical protein